jgi:hypothetical protein
LRIADGGLGPADNGGPGNRTVKRIEQHLATLNRTVAKNVLEIARIQAVLEEREAAGWPEGDGRRKIYVPRSRAEWAQFMPWAITVIGSVMYALGCNLGWW